jgi:hypothetical protein
MSIRFVVWGLQVCCESRLQAALKGHCDCFIGLAPDQQYDGHGHWDVYPCVLIVLHKGNMEFIQQLFRNHHWIALAFGKICIDKCDSDSLQVAVREAVGMDLFRLVYRAIRWDRVDCLRVLRELRARVQEKHLLIAAIYNSLSCLELILAHNPPSCPMLQSQAACAGNVRFLMRIFRPDAGWPVWNTAMDGDPIKRDQNWIPGVFMRIPVGQEVVVPLFMLIRSRSLVVYSSNLVCSGPVLLYAAQLRVPLTPLMEEMLQDVRGRALALAGCFHRAAAIRKVPGPIYRKLDAMGQVPDDIIKSIATMARISIADQKFMK